METDTSVPFIEETRDSTQEVFESVFVSLLYATTHSDLCSSEAAYKGKAQRQNQRSVEELVAFHGEKGVTDKQGAKSW